MPLAILGTARPPGQATSLAQGLSASLPLSQMRKLGHTQARAHGQSAMGLHSGLCLSLSHDSQMCT